MCSITDSRLAMIGTAIDELAEAARAEAAHPRAALDASGTMAERVAGIWAMVAELDPGLARRLAQYADPEPGADD
jgi:hypothetical protein